MVRSFTAQERATAASLRVSWILAKKKRPFTDSETVKDCMLAVVDEVINDDKIKTSVASAIKNVPLSDTSNIRRVEILAADVYETLLGDLMKADTMSIAVVESTDKTDTAQLCIYVSFFLQQMLQRGAALPTAVRRTHNGRYSLWEKFRCF